MFLHEQHVIELQGGLAVLRQAMTLRLAKSARGRYYNKGDYKPLDVHYRGKAASGPCDDALCHPGP